MWSGLGITHKGSFILPKENTDPIQPGEYGVVAWINVAKQSSGGTGALPHSGTSQEPTTLLSVPWVCQQQPLGRTRLETETASTSLVCYLPLVLAY